jgi:transcription factor IIIB subunit 2
MKCSKCGSRDIDFQEAGGQSICINCGTVLEESTIVSSIEFQVDHVVIFAQKFVIFLF